MVFVARPPLETPTGRFLGVAHFQRLLREPPHAAVGSVLDSDVEGVSPDAPLGRVTRILATYDLLCVPVLDAEKRLLGAISVDDVLDHMLPDDWRENDDDVDAERARAAVADGSATARTAGRGGASGVARG